MARSLRKSMLEKSASPNVPLPAEAPVTTTFSSRMDGSDVKILFGGGFGSSGFRT
jgi:hypothetical protein